MRKFGWIPDEKDDRDYQYVRSAKLSTKELPAEGSVISLFPQVYQQGNLGSCVGQATKALMAASYTKQIQIDPNLSALMIYYTAREIENSINEDVGCSPRDALKGVAKIGVCTEMLWPYIISRFADRPSFEAYEDALNHQILSYYSINPALSLLRGCIADGYPFSVGVRVFENFPMEIGEIPMPKGQEIGGHDIVIVGYNDNTRKFIVRNSWGVEWGISGYGAIPYDYLTDYSLASDFWTIRMVETEINGTLNKNSGCIAALLGLFGRKE
jgi:C1A family cysteine protease